MRDMYRGFEVERKSGSSIYQIFEAGKLVGEAVSETAAYDRIDTIIMERRIEDASENARTYRR